MALLMTRRARRGTILAIAIAVGGGLASSTPAGAMTAARYTLSTSAYELGSFTDLKTITNEVEVIAPLPNTTSAGLLTFSFTARVKFPVVTLKRPLSGSVDMSAWHESVLKSGLTQRQNVSLVARNPDGKVIARWWLERAWPVKVEVTAAQAGNVQELSETVTLTAESMRRIAS